MAKITAYTDLSATEFSISLGGSTLTLNVAGNLSNDGATGQAVFSAIEALWKSGATHNRYRFAFAQAVGELAASLELQGGWVNGDATTLTLIRDSGLRFRSGFGASASVTKEWACLVQSGTFELASSQPYTLLDTDTVPTNLTFTGDFNELVKIFDSGGDDDRASLKVYSREEGYTYGYYDLNTSQEITTLLPVSYLIPMSTETDSNWGTTDAAVAADAPYTGMTLYTSLDSSGFAAWANSTVYAADAVVSDTGRWYSTILGGTSSGTGVGDDSGVTDWVAYAGERSIDSVYYAFDTIIDGNSGTKQQVWEYHQYQLRQTGDIDANSGVTQRGDTGIELLSWSGNILSTDTGVYVDNFLAAEGPEYIFTDVGGVGRTIADTIIYSATNIIDDSRARLYNVTAAGLSAWQATTPYVVGNRVLRTTGVGSELGDGVFFYCSVAGTSGGSEPTWDVAARENTTTDNTVTWVAYPVEIDNSVVSGGSGYTYTLVPNEEFSSGDVITLLAAYHQSGVAKQVFRSSSTVTSADVTISDSQINWDDPGPNTLAIDGSTVSECSTDYANIEVEISDPDDTTQKQRIAAFIVDALQEEDGIRNWVDLSGNPVITYSTNTAAQIDITVAALSVVNTKATGELLIQDTFELDWSDGTDRVSTSTGPSTLWLVPARVLTITSGSGVTAQDKTDIIDGVHSKEVENSETFIQTTRLIRAATVGESAVSGSTVTFRDAADAKDRITATVDSNGQRTSVTTDSS